jgi:hypothetical protein
MPTVRSDQPRQPACLARQRPRAVQAQRRIARIAHIGFDDRRVDPHGPGLKACLAPGLCDHTARQLLDHDSSESAGQLAHSRLVRHALPQRDQTEAAQVQRVRDLAHQRLVSPSRALLDHHQAHIDLHRDRRATLRNGLRAPMRRDRLHHSRIAQQRIQSRQVFGEFPHLVRQHLVPQRLDLPIRQSQHQHPPRSEKSPFAGSILLIESDGARTISGPSS